MKTPYQQHLEEQLEASIIDLRREIKRVAPMDTPAQSDPLFCFLAGMVLGALAVLIIGALIEEMRH